MIKISDLILIFEWPTQIRVETLIKSSKWHMAIWKFKKIYEDRDFKFLWNMHESTYYSFAENCNGKYTSTIYNMTIWARLFVDRKGIRRNCVTNAFTDINQINTCKVVFFSSKRNASLTKATQIVAYPVGNWSLVRHRSVSCRRMRSPNRPRSTTKPNWRLLFDLCDSNELLYIAFTAYTSMWLRLKEKDMETHTLV